MENQTTVTEFILVGLTSDPQLQIVLSIVFLVISLITLVGNAVITLVIQIDSHLHTPMYFFLSHLSIVDLCYSSTVVPKMLVSLLTMQTTISTNACFTQMFFIFLSGTGETFMLSIMAYDRYAAICKPLHYVRIMNKKMCRQLVGVAWTMSFIEALVNTVLVLKLHFCGSNEIMHFSCELPPLLMLSCTETFINNITLLSSVLFICVSTSLIIFISYIHIISTIFRIRSAEGRKKTFSTCSSHLIVVVLWYGTALFQYMKPSSISSVILDQVFSLQYSVVTPMLNPIIYSLKNKEVKTALRRIFKKKIWFSTVVVNTRF